MKTTAEEIEYAENNSSFMKALVAPLLSRTNYIFLSKKILNIIPLCSSCGLDIETGILAGCEECTARFVMES